MQPALIRPRHEAIDHDDLPVHERRAARPAAPFPRAGNSSPQVRERSKATTAASLAGGLR
jgi:hypothetical protein